MSPGAAGRDEPLVSVILPIYNRAHLLPRAAGSVLTQDWPNLELIVVDDASTEDLRPVVAALNDPRVRYLRRDTNGGAAAARNTGIEAATGEFIAFQDSDDEWLEGKLRKQVDAMLRAPSDVGFVYTDIRREYPNRSLISPTARLKQRSGDLSRVVLGEGQLFSYVQTWLVRASALREVGGFDPVLKLWEDWDLCVRLTRRYKVAYIPGVHVVSPRLADSITSDSSLWLPAHRYIASKHEAELARGGKDAARYYHRLARMELRRGDARAGRRACWRALRARPTLKSALLAVVAALRLEKLMFAVQDRR